MPTPLLIFDLFSFKHSVSLSISEFIEEYNVPTTCTVYHGIRVTKTCSWPRFSKSKAWGKDKSTDTHLGARCKLNWHAFKKIDVKQEEVRNNSLSYSAGHFLTQSQREIIGCCEDGFLAHSPFSGGLHRKPHLRVVHRKERRRNASACSLPPPASAGQGLSPGVWLLQTPSSHHLFPYDHSVKQIPCSLFIQLWRRRACGMNRA